MRLKNKSFPVLSFCFVCKLVSQLVNMSLFKLLNLGRVLLTYAKQRRGHRFRSLDDRADEEDISGEIVVITGANAGIGKVLCLEMAKRNATI